MSPADLAYLDQKYDESFPSGLRWAGLVEVDTAYRWDPGTLLPGVAPEAVLGVEAPLWSETLTSMADVDQMAFPRLLGTAELGWSPAGRVWAEYRGRPAAHGPRLDAAGVDFHRSPTVDWLP
ncbi:family 20 glycosylhydrolase [Streptomyces sp. NPDC060194]|uniref:family 20 glycosylhydrolase n=1 Tax=Streptomyces sp. NPDC060194 TaxID=3347069 RepID=UPI0036531999